MRLIRRHKILSTCIIVFLAGGSIFAYQRFTSIATETSYVTALVSRDTLLITVSGSGQVSASNQIDIKPKAGGTVTSVRVSEGEQIVAGTVIAQLDSRDAEKTVRDAVTNLESARLSLEKLKKPADALSALQAENSLEQAKESRQKADEDLAKSREDGFNAIANAFLDLPGVMSGLQDVLLGITLNSGQANLYYYADAVKNYDAKVITYRDDAYAAYQKAREAYNKTFDDYKTLSRSSNNAQIEAMMSQTYETTKIIADAVKSANNLIQFYKDKLAERNFTPNTLANAHLSSLNTSTGQTNGHLTTLLNLINGIKNNRDTITNADRTIAEKTESLAKLRAGTDPLDIRSQELTIRQRENTLTDAREKLADYTIRAPFAGTITNISIKRSDTVSSGAAAATLITDQKLAEISLNEVDAAQIKRSQKVTLMFDAIPSLSITGEVAEIDTVGTVTQGVVTYKIKIAFDTQDQRIKSGMSTNASVITDIRQDTLVVPNAAVKTSGDGYYVEVFDTPLAQNQGSPRTASPVVPRQQTVEIGLSNDTRTEIISGLKEGDQVVTRTVNATASTQTTQAPSLFPTPGNRNIRTQGTTNTQR